ncbi:nicotinate (nicotinamide) nucleotide adenylyltransferase [Moraxella oblonga]|uniref:nicotinate (nicotinamide) nucleotide adenylyltransferase n=1 Tax=Moraxella oblonga TaxID=200413 RepID=UPI00082D8984|nr:nicotinate (nicotinamide) nucleotide adenylyltransferase [Moraxella oblonga]
MIRVYFGGSFDPVHEGHLDMVRYVAKKLTAQKTPFIIYFLPTAGNPFKDNPTSPTHRLAMLDLACEMLKNEGVVAQICPLEIHQTPPIYTVDSVRTLANTYPNDERIFVMGGDSLSSLHLWKNYQEILTLVKIWAFARACNNKEVHESIVNHITTDFYQFLNQASIFYDNSPIRAVSSSQIRQDFLENKTPTHLPCAIFDYIKQQKLYKTVI